MSFLAGNKDIFEKAYKEHVFIAWEPIIYEDYCISLHSKNRYHYDRAAKLQEWLWNSRDSEL